MNTSSSSFCELQVPSGASRALIFASTKPLSISPPAPSSRSPPIPPGPRFPPVPPGPRKSNNNSAQYLSISPLNVF